MRRLIVKGLITSLLIFVLSASSLYSQEVEKATRETDRLGREKEKIEEGLKKIPEKPLLPRPEAAPLKKEEEEIFIKKITLAGCESFPPEEFSSIIEKYQNRELALTDLEILAQEIEREYLRRGIVAAVFVPQQEIKEQTAALQAVEAKMGNLQIQEHGYFKKGRLYYYWEIPSGEIMRYDKISRSVQLMNKNPDRQVKANLAAGKKPGSTDVILTPQTNFPIHLTGSFDREGSVSTGEKRVGYGMRHNNLLGLDDTFLSGSSFGRDFSGIYAYHSLPISPYGTSLLYGYSRSESSSKKEFTDLGIKSQAQNTSLSIHQDLYRKDEYLGESFLGFNAKDKTTWLTTGTYNRDRLRTIDLGANFIFRGPGSATSLAPEFSQGVDTFGASSNNNPLASRNANSTFSKFNLGIQYKRMLPFDGQANYKFNTQLSSTKLTPQEEFSLGGIDSVRGYPSSDYLADNAVLNSLEILIPVFFIPKNLRLPYDTGTLREELNWVSFVDYGYGARRGALATEKKSVNFCSVGTGLRIKILDQLVLRLEWGFPVGNDTITEAGHARFHFSLDFQEKLPETIKRIKKNTPR